MRFPLGWLCGWPKERYQCFGEKFLELNYAKEHEAVNIGRNQNKLLKMGLVLKLKVKNLSTGTNLNAYSGTKFLTQTWNSSNLLKKNTFSRINIVPSLENEHLEHSRRERERELNW